MSKLSSRINKLILKTHVFISRKKLILIRDYYKALLDDANVKTEDREEKIKKVKEILILSQKDKSVNFIQERNEMIKEDPIICEVIFYYAAIEYYEKYPKGNWFTKKQGQRLQEQLHEAKEYFNKKQKFDF